MKNQRYSEFGELRNEAEGSPPKTPRGHRPDATPESTAAWPGLPGKAQSKTRDKSGTPKCVSSAKQEGL